MLVDITKKRESIGLNSFTRSKSIGYNIKISLYFNSILPYNSPCRLSY